MVIFAMHRLVAHVAEGVVHPAHVPLESEAEPAGIDRTRDAREGGRFLRQGNDARILLVADLVELLEEGDCLDVLATAVLVRDPLPVLPGIIEVQHRGHRIDA